MPSIKQTALLGAALLLRQVNAHGWVQGILAEGKYYPGQSHWTTEPSPGWKANNGDNGFVAPSLTDPNIICHNDAVPGSLYVAVTAGSSIELQWSPWPESHKGPVLDYLAPCGDDCTTVEKTKLQFTKIDEAGLIDATSTPQQWASDKMITNNNTWVTTIPASIAPGKYVLRHETIALHAAENEGGAQAYPQCINLEVSGSGTNGLASGTLGTELYTATDPGIKVNIYYPVLTSYDIPGPEVMAGGSGSGSGSSSTASASSSASTSASGIFSKSTSIAISATATTKVAAASSTTTPVASVKTTSKGSATPASSAAASETATIAGRKFVCYEEP